MIARGHAVTVEVAEAVRETSADADHAETEKQKLEQLHSPSAILPLQCASTPAQGSPCILRTLIFIERT